MTTPSHRSAQIFREAAALFLNTAGLATTPRTARRSLAGAFADDGPASTDIVGVPGVAFLVRAQRTPELSRSLDLAQSVAEADGTGTAVAVLRRVGRPISEQYALLTLSSLAPLLSERKTDEPR